MNVVSATGVTKSYGPLQALRGIDLSVREGEVLCVLGPNGAGKTTTLEILEGHQRRDAGSVSVLGHDPDRAPRAMRERVGVVLQSSGTYGALTVAETLQLFRGYYADPEPLDDLLDMVELTAKAGAKVRTLSGGQRRRLDLALGLVGRPALLFLDEPTTGFDPEARAVAWRLIGDLPRRGTAVLLTTHYLEEAHTLADTIVIIAAGRVVAQGSPDEVSRMAEGGEVSFRLTGSTPESLPADLAEQVRERDGRVVLTGADPDDLLGRAQQWAADRGAALSEIDVSRRGLDQVYRQLTAESTTNERAT